MVGTVHTRSMRWSYIRSNRKPVSKPGLNLGSHCSYLITRALMRPIEDSFNPKHHTLLTHKRFCFGTSSDIVLTMVPGTETQMGVSGIWENL